MSKSKLIIENSELQWDSKRRYRVNAVVFYSDFNWQNLTGQNSEPGTGSDWIKIPSNIVPSPIKWGYVTAVNGGIRVIAVDEDILSVEGSSVTNYTITLPTLTEAKEVSITFNAAVTNLTINAGGVIDYVPTSAKSYDTWTFVYEPIGNQWILKSYWSGDLGSQITALPNKGTITDIDIFAISDSSASSAPKKVTASNLQSNYLKPKNDLLYSKLIDAKQFGAVADGTTNDTTILQYYLDSGQGIYIFPKGNYSISGIDVNPYSKLYFEEGAVLVLRNNSDRPVLQNKNFSVNTDKNIEIYGLEIEGNEANQIKIGVTAPYTGEPTSGIRFFGVENLKIIGAKINKTRTYGIWISRVKNVIARDIEFNQSILVRDNQDGIHFNGLCYNLHISNIRGVTNDDMIALNANDTAQGSNVSFGEIKNATIKDVVFDNNLNGIRLLSAGNLMDQVYISNLSGNVRDNVVAISSYNLGTANFGSIYIDGVNVRTNTPFNVMGEYGGYILVNDKIEYLKISNVYRETGADARPTIRIQGRANISKLIIDNITDKINQSLTTYYPEISFESGSIVAQSFISNIRLMNGVYPNGYCIGATGSAITRLHLDNIYAEQIGYGLYLNNTDISTLFVNNLSTNFIRYPFYLVNDSDVLNALITNNKWSYSLGTPNVYNILDTSSIVFAGSPTAQTLIKWDDSYNLANSSVSETPTVTSVDRILRLPPDKQLALGLATATNGVNITYDSTNKRTSLTTNGGNRIIDFVDFSRATLINGATDNATDKLIVNGTASGTTDANLPSQYVRLGQIPTSGNYTPTLTGVSNTTSIGHSGKSVYTKVGNIVTFKVAFSIVPTIINTATSFDITLPIVRANTGTDTIGSGTIPNTGTNYSSCLAQSTTTTTVRVYFYALGISSSQGVINCEYDITQ